MNVLVLTPDAVGSTLLQRLITVYMQLHDFGRPVVNLHELTNGLDKSFMPEFNQEMVGKAPGKWGLHQTLKEVIDLVDSVDHYKVARVAKYIIKRRNDPINEQVPFYRYLNDNFFIIACRRQNVFEHAISWGMNKITRRNNVFSHDQKIDLFFDIYARGIEIDTQSLIDTLENYREYLAWCDQYFGVASYFYYEQHLKNIEEYILGLPVFAGQKKKTFQDIFGIDFQDWNRCHYYVSDIGALAMTQQERFQQLVMTKNSSAADESNNELITLQTQTVMELLPEDKRTFLLHNREGFEKVNQCLADMRKLKIVGAVPIKRQTLSEKKFVVKNWQQCIDTYNEWIVRNPDIGNIVDDQGLENSAMIETQHWGPRVNSASIVALADQSANQP